MFWIKRNAVLYVTVLLMLSAIAGCTGNKTGNAGGKRVPKTSDTLYIKKMAMTVYDYQPEQALRIIDSAVVRGQMKWDLAEYLRMKVYCCTLMGDRVDSLLHGPEDVRFDSAQVIGERLLTHHTAGGNLEAQEDVLELMVWASRMKSDTLHYVQYSEQLVDVCHRLGAETEALRTEADLSAALYSKGLRARAKERIDSVIGRLETLDSVRFNELDATIIALKRKIVMLNVEERIVETIPLASRIIDLLNDYEKHPEAYHDGTYREPEDSTERGDYIEFYRSQAQSSITAAYAQLGETGSMNEAYAQIERSVREATAREHQARYRALEEAMRRTEAESESQLMTTVAKALIVGLFIIVSFAVYVNRQRRKIAQKNKVLVRQINEAMAYKEKLLAQKPVAEKPSEPRPAMEKPQTGLPAGSQEPLSEAATGMEAEEPPADSDDGSAEFFRHIDGLIRSERIYADATIQRQDICERFCIRREVLNQLLSTYADGKSFPAYINGIRLNEACRLLKDEPDKTVAAIADEVGLSLRNLRRIFVEQYGMTPTEYRRGL